MWGATGIGAVKCLIKRVSIHAPRVGCDVARLIFIWFILGFNPRTPCGVRPSGLFTVVVINDVSIHAPRVGCDGHRGGQFTIIWCFNPRTPCGVRLCGCSYWTRANKFQSTHPVWGATRLHSSISARGIVSIHAPRVGCDNGIHPAASLFRRFNPRTPCGVRLAKAASWGANIVVSIHAPRVGCDPPQSVRRPPGISFNPRTPCGVRRAMLGYLVKDVGVSIHAPRVGCDPGERCTRCEGCSFNPRTPCGVRQGRGLLIKSISQFQSTHPVWGATGNEGSEYPLLEVSIHAPRVGCDEMPATDPKALILVSIHAPRVGCDTQTTRVSFLCREFQSTHPVWGATAVTDILCPFLGRFNPRTPCGVRRDSSWCKHSGPEVSIHAPRVGCDGLHNVFYIPTKGFQSTHPVWGATGIPLLPMLKKNCFNPRTPCGVRLETDKPIRI